MNIRNPKSYDLLGSIALVRFPKEFNQKEKKKFACKLLKNQKPIKTVLEKYGKIKGRLRKIQTHYLTGEKTKEVLYRENNCFFRFNIDTTYFSPRLSNERKEIASKIKKPQEVLVMFAGVSPYSIVIAKNSKAKKVYSVEINREANKYAKLNIELNKLKDKVELVQGDVKKVVEKIKKGRLSEGNRRCPRKFDVIVMPRPQLKDSFLKEAFSLSKKGTMIYYYDFCGQDDAKKSKIFGATKSKIAPTRRRVKDFVGIESIVEKIKKEAKNSGKRIKILNKKVAGETAPYKIRLRVDLKVLN